MEKLIDTIRKASDIRRYHTSRVIGEQTIGHHSYNVAMLARAITDNECSAELLRAALDHDIPEIETGDVPAPAKWRSDDLRKALDELEFSFFKEHGAFFHDLTGLPEDEFRVLSFCDMLELVLFCKDQRKMGNTHLIEVEMRGFKALKKRPLPENLLWSGNMKSILANLELEISKL